MTRLLIFILSLGLFTSCTSYKTVTYTTNEVSDDVYYSPNDYVPYDEPKKEEEIIYTKNNSDDYSYDYNISYTSRIKRFYRPIVNINYYSPYYTGWNYFSWYNSDYYWYCPVGYYSYVYYYPSYNYFYWYSRHYYNYSQHCYWNKNYWSWGKNHHYKYKETNDNYYYGHRETIVRNQSEKEIYNKHVKKNYNQSGDYNKTNTYIQPNTSNKPEINKQSNNYTNFKNRVYTQPKTNIYNNTRNNNYNNTINNNYKFKPQTHTSPPQNTKTHSSSPNRPDVTPMKQTYVGGANSNSPR